MLKLILTICLLTIFTFTINAQWQKQNVDTKASLRGLSVVNQNVIWASGTGGTFLKTVDGGKTWTVGKVPDADKLDFRDVEAFDANTAYLLSIGNGETSRIYKTIDGGKNWEKQFQATDKDIFLDAIAFWDKDHGIAMGDPVKGYYYLLRTTNGGKIGIPSATINSFRQKKVKRHLRQVELVYLRRENQMSLWFRVELMRGFFVQIIAEIVGWLQIRHSLKERRKAGFFRLRWLTVRTA